MARSSGTLIGNAPTVRDGMLSYFRATVLAEPAADLQDERTALEQDWAAWLRTLFPHHVTAAFASHQADLWDWAWAIQAHARPQPFVAVWPRGGAKSTTAELVTVALAARRTRFYVLYVVQSQERADDHVNNIAALLESSAIARYYPELGERLLSKFGASKGWRRNRLRTAGGFTVDALGLDTGTRGVKLEAQRPDLIILDDLDRSTDSLAVVERKIDTLTKAILPAGSTDVAVLAVQNRVHGEGIFARLADGRAEFLADRIVSGPVPAVEHLTAEQRGDRWVIVDGTPTWEGQDLATCQRQIVDWGYSAFLAEAQHEDPDQQGGMFDHLSFSHCPPEAVPALTRIVVWCDPAVTATDESDCQGIHADGLGTDGKIYRLWSWEQRSTPQTAILTALHAAVELGASTLGVETDQGGDAWESVYAEAIRQARTEGWLRPGVRAPMFAQAKAGAGHGSKVHRWQQMLSDYERGRFIHVLGTHIVLEQALRRVPRHTPYDLCDSAYYAWWDLRHNGDMRGRAPTADAERPMVAAWRSQAQGR